MTYSSSARSREGLGVNRCGRDEGPDRLKRIMRTRHFPTAIVEAYIAIVLIEIRVSNGLF